jgi:Fe-S oxidoreductase
VASSTPLSDDRKRALALLAERMDGELRTHLNSCVRCGLCGESCHYYLRYGDERYLPVNKVEQLARVYRRYHTVLGRLVP